MLSSAFIAKSKALKSLYEYGVMALQATEKTEIIPPVSFTFPVYALMIRERL